LSADCQISANSRAAGDWAAAAGSVLPGPGLLLLTAGLALLATEFPWAQRWLTRLRGHAKQAAQRVRPAKPSA
jgi:Putative transmembrane protein (PGPGW)